MNPATAEEFKGYLKEEVVKGSSGSYKKVIGTKVRKWRQARRTDNSIHVSSDSAGCVCDQVAQ